MKQHIVPAGDGPDYDWTNDHIFIKTPAEMTDGRVTLVEDILKPGFHLPRHHHQVMTEIFFVVEGEATFAFDDETVQATVGMTVTVPPGIRHEVSSPGGARFITVFTPGGFDHYLAELAALAPAQMDDPAVITALGRRYDIWVE